MTAVLRFTSDVKLSDRAAPAYSDRPPGSQLCSSLQRGDGGRIQARKKSTNTLEGEDVKMPERQDSVPKPFPARWGAREGDCWRRRLRWSAAVFLRLLLLTLALPAARLPAAEGPPGRQALLEQARRCRQMLKTSLVDFYLPGCI